MHTGAKNGLRAKAQKLLEKLPPPLIQFLKFGMVGAVNTILSYLITNTCYYALHLHEQISNFVSFLITVLVSFLLNSRFLLRQEESQIGRAHV